MNPTSLVRRLVDVRGRGGDVWIGRRLNAADSPAGAGRRAGGRGRWRFAQDRAGGGLAPPARPEGRALPMVGRRVLPMVRRRSGTRPEGRALPIVRRATIRFDGSMIRLGRLENFRDL